MHAMAPLRALVLAPLLLQPLTAQETAAPQPFLELRTVGPAGWRSAFLPTNLGSLLSSKEGEALWRPGMVRLEAMLGGLVGDGYAAAQERLLAYDGQITVHGFVRPRAQFTADPPMALVIRAAGDGHTDLAALAAELERGLGRLLDEPVTTAEVAGQPVRHWASRDHEWLTVPVVRDDALWIHHGFRIDLAEALAVTAPAPATGPRGPVLHARIDVAVLRRAMASDGGNDDDENALLRELGFDSLGLHTITLGTAGSHAQIEVAQQFLDAPRGIFGAFFPASTGVPALRHLLPADCEQCKAGRFDALLMYEAVEAAIGAVIGGDGGRAGVRQEVVQELGFDPVADLLRHGTDEWLVFGDVPLLDGLDRERGVDWGFVVRLKDAKAFAPSWDALLDKAMPTLQTQGRYEHQGIAVRKMGGMFLPTFHAAVAHDLLLVTFGPEAETRLRGTLDRAAAPAPAAEPPLPALLRGVARQAPPGLNGQTLIDLDTLIGRQLLTLLDELERSMLSATAEAAFDPEMVREAIDALLPLLRKHQLARLAALTGHQDGRWMLRLFW